jgi:WS/DGAT/MGAT family acyltransferase
MSRHRMASADAAWLHMDRPTNLMVVNAIMWFDEPVDHECMRLVVRERLVERFPPYRRRVVEPLGVPMWEDDTAFDLDRHVHHLALPAPGGRRELQAVAADLMATPLDRAKPLWDWYALDGYGDGMAIVVRMHHCIADGIALARVLLSLTDEEVDAGVARRSARRHHGVVGRLAAAGLHEAFDALNHPRQELAGLTADGDALRKLLLTGADAKTALSGELGVARRVAWSQTLPLDAIKAAGHRTGSTINDVVVAAFAGALRAYLIRRGTAVEDIRAMVPFNLRPLDEPLPRELGNKFGLVYLPLPVGVEDPAERLLAVNHSMNAIKRSPEAAVSFGILEAMGFTPPRVEQRLLDVFTTKATAVMTNVPGPRRPVWFAGTKLAGVLGWVPTAGHAGVGVSIFSYAGGLTLGLQVDAGLVPDPETIVADFESELAALRALRGPFGHRRRTRAAAAR